MTITFYEYIYVELSAISVQLNCLEEYILEL